jgi:serine/threonine protein phosphatase PrpC
VKIRDDVEIGQHSHVGMARTENQDFFGYWEPDDDRSFDLKGRLAVVCDGMGGHSGGEIASRIAVKAIIENYEQSESDNIVESLRLAIEYANATVHGEGVRVPELMGMGTTVTAVVQRREMVYFGQVGDSRAYLIRAGQMKQMTKDHSLVQQLVDEGLLDASEMETHPDKNVILRSLGVKPEVEVDVSHIPIADQDMFLICSDGLSGLITDAEMLEIVLKGGAGSLRAICEELVDAANNAGGHDNITVQIIRINQTASATTDTTPQETVTAAFTADQVQASIAQAKAEAAARGETPKPPTPTPDDSGMSAIPSPAPAGMPATKPAMPVPQMEDPPPKPGSGLAKLLGGLLLGVILGSGCTFGAMFAMQRGRAETAQIAAQEALKSKTGDATKSSLYKKAQQALDAGQLAYTNNDFEGARSHFLAARRLCELAGETQ